MDDLPPDDLTIPDVIVDPIVDVLRFYYQLRGLEVLLNSGKRTLMVSESSRNAVLDLREDPPDPEIVEE